MKSSGTLISTSTLSLEMCWHLRLLWHLAVFYHKKTVDQDEMKERNVINFKIKQCFILNYKCYFQLCREQTERVNIPGTKNVIEGLWIQSNVEVKLLKRCFYFGLYFDFHKTNEMKMFNHSFQPCLYKYRCGIWRTGYQQWRWDYMPYLPLEKVIILLSVISWGKLETFTYT